MAHHKILLVICVFFLFSFSRAQTTVIRGTVADSIDQKALQGVTIQVQNAANVILKRGTTDKLGKFSISIQNELPAQVIITYVSYRSQSILLDGHGKPVNDIGTILLIPETSSLAAIIVEGKRAANSFKVDRQVYKAAQFGNGANGTAVDVVRNLPSVSVNAQGEISFRGSNSFLVLINGKPTQGDPAFVMSQMAAGSIENIEVITSPSANFDADGKSGIINIITKNGVENGWMVIANAMGGALPINDYNNQRYKNPQRYGMDVSAGYNKNKLNINAGMNYLRNDISGFREGNVYTIIGDTKTSFPSTGERSFRRYNYGGRLSASYQLDAFNSIGAGLYIGKKFQSRVADLIYNNSRQDLVTGATSQFTYYNENTQDKEGVFTLANLEYTHQFANASKLSFSGLFERAGISGETNNLNLYYPNTADTIQYTKNPNSNPLNAYRLKVDYNSKMGNGEILAGYQFRYDVQNGDFLYLTSIPGTPDFETNPDFSSKVKVDNRIHAVYAQYTADYKRFHYSGGLRVEQADRLLFFSQNAEKNVLSLFNLFPSVQLRYKAWDRGIIKGGYNRRIKRTNNFELNPFPEREHSETMEQGDPRLLPELTGTYEIGVEQNFSKGSWFFTVYHQRVANPIQRVNNVYADTILNRVFTNAGMARSTGFETNLNLQVNKAWQIVAGGNVYYYTINGSIFNGQIPISSHSWVYSLNHSQLFTLQHNWSLQLSVNYLSARATAQGKDAAFLTPHLTVKKTTKDKRWYAQVQWLNIDAGMKISNRQRITTWGSDFYTTTNYIYEADQVQFSIGFNLLRRNRKIVLPQSEIGEKEF